MSSKLVSIARRDIEKLSINELSKLIDMATLRKNQLITREQDRKINRTKELFKNVHHGDMIYKHAHSESGFNDISTAQYASGFRFWSFVGDSRHIRSGMAIVPESEKFHAAEAQDISWIDVHHADLRPTMSEEVQLIRVKRRIRPKQ